MLPSWPAIQGSLAHGCEPNRGPFLYSIAALATQLSTPAHSARLQHAIAHVCCSASLHTKGKRWYASCMAQVITGNVVSYIRTSTDRQRRSGLGIEAQRAVARFAESEGLTVIAEYVETETG